MQSELVYDLRTQPWSLADPLIAQAAKLCETDSYDFVFLHDPDIRPPSFEFIPRNFGDNLDWSMASAKALKSTKSVSIRTATDEPEEPYQYYANMAKIVSSDKFPVLQVRDELREWAEYFHEKHGTIGTVNIRQHPKIPHSRDANVDAWREFLGKVDRKFVVLGDVSDIEGHIYYSNGVGRQLALVQTAKMHMGSSSGPLEMALIGKTPYRAFNTNMMRILPQYFIGNRFIRGPDNRHFAGKETADLLMSQFQELSEVVQ